MICSVCAVQAKTLDVAAGWVKPPYIIVSKDSGYELDMVKAIFAKLGYSLKLFYVPHARAYKMMSQGKMDVVLTVNDRIEFGKLNVLSDAYITYHNVAISLRSKEISIGQVEDLGNYSMIAFGQASKVLGAKFAQAIIHSPQYIELSEQRDQVKLLYQGRTELLIIDINIFRYLSDELYGDNPRPKVDIHKVFAVNPFQLGFKDAHLRDKFNKALAKFKDSPEHQQLRKRYRWWPEDGDHTISLLKPIIQR